MWFDLVYLLKTYALQVVHEQLFGMSQSKAHRSTVVIWSGHIGLYEGQALLLGQYLRKDLVNRGTLE
jgi:hypothetical protein